MKLSEAITQGATIRPQTFNGLFTKADQATEYPGGSCALGAAYEAVYGAPDLNELDELEAYRQLVKSFPILLRENLECPECGIRKTIWATLAHLNDYHFYTRESIAVWVAEQEAK